MTKKSKETNSAHEGGQEKRFGFGNVRLGHRSVWEVLTHNWVLKLLAVFFAFVLWGYVISETNPRRAKTLVDVPIEIRGVDSLRGKKLAMLNPGSQKDLDVRLTLSLAHRDLGRVDKSDVTVIADVSGIVSEGTHRITLRATTPAGDVKTIEPSTIDITVEPTITRQVPVRLKTVGKLPEGYWQGKAEIMPSQLSIEGAKSDVSRVASVLVELPLGNRTSSFSGAMGFDFVDENDMSVPSGSVIPTLESVQVNIPILPTKDVPVNVLAALEGADRLQTNFEIGSIDVVPNRVRIAAAQEILDGIDSVLVSPINVADAASDVTMVTDILLPAGVEMLETDRAAITVHIIETEKTRTMEDVPIYRFPVRDGEPAQALSTTGRITIKGRASEVDAFTVGDITLYVDESTLASGVHARQVMHRLRQPVDLEVEVFPQTVEVVVEALAEP